MKTTMKQLAAGTFIAILLMVGNVQAEGTETKTTSQAIETTLHLEKWMTSENLLSVNSFDMSELIIETEPSIQIENWMMNSETWNNDFIYSEEIESGIQIETWMKNYETRNAINITTETETELSLENWMTSENNWNR